MGDVLRIRDLRVGFAGIETTQLLPPINFTVKAGQIVSLVGHNGSGKSTLLKTLVGLHPSLGGSIELLRGPLAYVPQRESIDPIYPVRVDQICSTGRYPFCGVGRWLRTQDHAVVDECLGLMGVLPLKRRLFRTLSGGEQQRVLIARALCMKPSLMVLDEPTANMDFRGAAAVMEVALRLTRENNVAILVVNHFLDIVAKVSEQVVLVDRDHQVVRVGAPKEVLEGFSPHA
jgi:zinc transport system ATP-binding protein